MDAGSGPGVAVRVLDAVIDAMNLIGSGLIVLLVLLIGADIALRNLADSPVIGVPEIVSLSIVGIVFLQLPYTVRAGRLTRSDALLNLLRARHDRVRRWCDATFDLAAMAMAGLILRFSWPLMDKAIRDGLFVGARGTFTAPTWPVRVAVVIATTVLMLQLARQILTGQRGGP